VMVAFLSLPLSATSKPTGFRPVGVMPSCRCASTHAVSRHRSMVDAGGSHDFDEYHPHVTISFDVPANTDLTALKPY